MAAVKIKLRLQGNYFICLEGYICVVVEDVFWLWWNEVMFAVRALSQVQIVWKESSTSERIDQISIIFVQTIESGVSHIDLSRCYMIQT